MPRPKKVEDADLSTLGGIATARADLYNKLMAGTIPEQRANTAERILRGQQVLKGDLPMRFIRLMAGARDRNGKVSDHIKRAASDLATFLGDGPRRRRATLELEGGK